MKIERADGLPNEGVRFGNRAGQLVVTARTHRRNLYNL